MGRAWRQRLDRALDTLGQLGRGGPVGRTANEAAASMEAWEQVLSTLIRGGTKGFLRNVTRQHLVRLGMCSRGTCAICWELSRLAPRMECRLQR